MVIDQQYYYFPDRRDLSTGDAEGPSRGGIHSIGHREGRSIQRRNSADGRAGVEIDFVPIPAFEFHASCDEHVGLVCFWSVLGALVAEQSLPLLLPALWDWRSGVVFIVGICARDSS